MPELYSWGSPLIDEDGHVTAVLGQHGPARMVEEFLHQHCLYECVEHDQTLCEECITYPTVRYERWRKVVRDDEAEDGQIGFLAPWGTGTAYLVTTFRGTTIFENLDPFGYH